MGPNLIMSYEWIWLTVEFESLGLDGLDVESLRGRDVRGLLRRQLLEHRRLARVVQPQQQDAQLAVGGRLQLAQDRQQTHLGEIRELKALDAISTKYCNMVEG